MSIESFLAAHGLKASRKACSCFPDEIIELSDEQLEGIAGGVLNSVDIAYCHVAVEYYHSRGYTLSQMEQEMTSYQNQLRANGQTALADLSAEYLEYMIGIW